MVRLATFLAFAMLCASCARDEAAPMARVRPDVALAADTEHIRGVVPHNATLDTMLRGHGVAADAAQAIVAAARTVFDPRRLRSLQPFSLIRTLDGALRSFEYEIDAQTFLRIASARPVGGELRAELLPIPRTLEHAAISGSIDETASSLFASIDAAGERPELAVAIASVLSGEIDFNTELQPGDRYGVAFERFRREGRPDVYGDISAVEFHNDGRVVRAFRFAPSGGTADYYDENGRSLRRFFLKSPLKFDPTITSRFSMRRLHPVLQTVRAHRGVDYGAPTGAPVVAVASGTVLSATHDSVNGRMVRLRHASGYETNYLHLSAFAPGIRAGARVSQGQLIGRVGSTGLASGPHLHYGLKKNGVYVDPVREHRQMPPGEPISPAAMPAFVEQRDRALSQLSASL